MQLVSVDLRKSSHVDPFVEYYTKIYNYIYRVISPSLGTVVCITTGHRGVFCDLFIISLTGQTLTGDWAVLNQKIIGYSFDQSCSN